MSGIVAINPDIIEYASAKEALRRVEVAAKIDAIKPPSEPRKVGAALREESEWHFFKDSGMRSALEKYEFLYDFAPIALSESDCTELKEYIGAVETSGAGNFRNHIREQSRAVVECLDKLTVLNVNDAMVALLEGTNKEELKTGWKKLMDDDSMECFRAGIIAYAEGAPAFASETAIKTFKGNTRQLALTWSIMPGFEESRSRVIHSFVNVTEMHKAVEELKNFKAMSDTSCVGNALCDLEGNLIYVNNAFVQMHGYEVEEIVGKHFSIFHTEDQLQNLKPLLARIQNEGSLVNVEVWHRKKCGAVFPTLSNASFIRDEHGTPLFVATMAIDITTFNEMRRELELRNRNIEEANVALRVVIETGQKEKSAFEQKVLENIRTSVKPVLMKLKESGLNVEQRAYLDVVESALHNIAAPFKTKLSLACNSLTPAELQIATLISEGRRTKEIAEALHLAKKTIDVHRHNIRKKLGIRNLKVNLQLFLSSL